MTDHTFTLAKLRAEQPCIDGWRKLLTALGNLPLDTRISIGDVALAYKAADAFWCMRLIDDPRVCVGAVMPAVRRAVKHTDDQRVHDCVAAIERWLAGEAVDLRAAAWAARAAARTAGTAGTAGTAEAAAWAAAWAAEAARAADAGETAAWAVRAARAAGASEDDADAERALQVRDLVELFPPLVMQEDGR